MVFMVFGRFCKGDMATNFYSQRTKLLGVKYSKSSEVNMVFTWTLELLTNTVMTYNMIVLVLSKASLNQ